MENIGYVFCPRWLCLNFCLHFDESFKNAYTRTFTFVTMFYNKDHNPKYLFKDKLKICYNWSWSLFPVFIKLIVVEELCYFKFLGDFFLFLLNCFFFVKLLMQQFLMQFDIQKSILLIGWIQIVKRFKMFEYEVVLKFWVTNRVIGQNLSERFNLKFAQRSKYDIFFFSDLHGGKGSKLDVRKFP